MASMSRLALEGAPRLCFNKSATAAFAFTTSFLDIPKTKLSRAKSITSSNNSFKKPITLKSSTAAAAVSSLGIQTLAAQFRGSSAPHGSSPLFNSSAGPSVPLQQKRNFSSFNMPLPSQCPRLLNQNAIAPVKNRRYISSKEITKNLTLYTHGPFKNEVDKNTLELKEPSDNPLVVMMAWLMAKQKHLKKYVEIYTELGFDVMVVQSTPWQFLWPTKGTQVVAADMLKFLDNNKLFAPIVMHGFSVGAYQFGEVMLQMSKDMERYSHILNRIVCQVWDSAADITEVPEGVPKSIFPNNPRMETALRNYTLYHMKTFHNQATIHYMRSSQMFHFTLCKKPALFFVSENDPIGPPSSNQSVREDWESAGVKCTFKVWKHSQHAAHLIKYRDEYLDILFKHLEDCGVLEAVAVKQRVKL